jgi:hypothetical protein
MEDQQVPHVAPMASTHSRSDFSSIMPYISRPELPNGQHDIHVPPLASTQSRYDFSSIMPYISRPEHPNDQNDIPVYVPSQVRPAGANPLEAPPAPMAVIVSPTGARSVSHCAAKSLSRGNNDAVQTEVFTLRSSTDLIGN